MEASADITSTKSAVTRRRRTQTDHGALQNGGSRQKISNYWSGTFQKWFHGGPKKDAKCQELSNKKKRRTFWCNKMQFFENLLVWFWKWFYLVKRLCLFFFYMFQLFVYNPQLLVFVPHIDIISTLCILQVVVCGLPQCR